MTSECVSLRTTTLGSCSKLPTHDACGMAGGIRTPGGGYFFFRRVPVFSRHGMQLERISRLNQNDEEQDAGLHRPNSIRI